MDGGTLLRKNDAYVVVKIRRRFTTQNARNDNDRGLRPPLDVRRQNVCLALSQFGAAASAIRRRARFIGRLGIIEI